MSTTDPAIPDTGTRYSVTRTVAAPPEAVFALLTDPSRHHETEPTDWVRGSLEVEPAPRRWGYLEELKGCPGRDLDLRRLSAPRRPQRRPRPRSPAIRPR